MQRLRQPNDTEDSIKPGVEAQNLLDPVLLHDGHMKSITCREFAVSQDDGLRLLDGPTVNIQHFINNSEDGIEGRLYRVATINSDIAMKDFLQNLGVGDKAFAVCNQAFQKALSVNFVAVRRTHQIHRNVGINEDHCCEPLRY